MRKGARCFDCGRPRRGSAPGALRWLCATHRVQPMLPFDGVKTTRSRRSRAKSPLRETWTETQGVIEKGRRHRKALAEQEAASVELAQQPSARQCYVESIRSR